MKKLTALAMVILMALTILVGAGASDPARASGSYKIGVVPWAGWSPTHVAQAKGFWKELGIDVTVVNFSSNTEIHNAIKNGRIDLAFDMLGSVVGLYMEGEDVVILGETDWSHGGDKIIVKKGLDLAAEKGKIIGIYLDKPSVTFFLHKYLSSKGLKLTDFKVAQMEPDVLADNFIAGRLPLIINYDPNALRAEREGNGELAATSSTYEGVIPEGMFAYRSRVAKIPAEDLEKIFTGWVKAVEWTKDPANWKEYMEILNKSTFAGDAPYSEADLKGMMDSVKIHSPEEMILRNQPSGGLETYLDELKSFLKQSDMLAKDFDKDKLVENKVLLKVLYSR